MPEEERRRPLDGPWIVLAALAVVVVVNVPELGSDPWTFRVDAARDQGVLGPLVRAAGNEWDLGILRAAALLAGLLVVGAALASRRLGSRALVAVTGLVLALLLVPAVLLQVGLRQASAPWAYTNDSTYQIELAGDLLLEGDNPYGHDYRGSGLERWYTAVEEETDLGAAALDHFAYFPGTALTAAAWRLLPAPFDDYRVFVLLATLALAAAALLFPGPLPLRLAAGALLAANPLAVRAAWFGTADATSLLLLVVAFALTLRGRVGSAAAALAGAVLLKQFALVALPFVAALLIVQRVPPPALRRGAAIFAGVLFGGIVPFALADASALWDDTVAYGADTYRIIGYGLAGILVELGLVDRRGDYPFLVAAAVAWLPVTAWLLRRQLRSAALWPAAAGFAASIFLLFYVSRVFQNSYLVWPLVGLVLAGLLAAVERARAGSSA